MAVTVFIVAVGAVPSAEAAPPSCFGATPTILGTEEGDSWQILSGVEPDLTVATSNLDQLYEGAKVAF